jgi:hypothetical protein
MFQLFPGSSGPVLKPGLPLLGPPMDTDGRPAPAPEEPEFDHEMHCPSFLDPNQARQRPPACEAPSGAVIVEYAGPAAAASTSAPKTTPRHARRVSAMEPPPAD